MSTTYQTPARPALFTEGFLEDPFPVYRRFLSEGSIHHLDWGGGRNFWTVFGYSDVLSVLKDPALSARRMKALLLPIPEDERAQFGELARVMGQWLLFMDAPEHSRLRKLMNKGFAPAAIELLRPQVEAIVDRMLEPMRRASEAELMHAIAHPLPVRIIAELLGIPDTLQSQLVAWSDAIAIFSGNPQRTVEQTRAAQDAILGLTAYFREIVAKRRLNKGSDLISLLLDIEEDGEVLTEDELYAQCVMLLFAGHETTRNLIGNGMHSLLQRPREMEKLRDNPDLIRSGVEELLRFDSPIQYLSRIVKEDTKLLGMELHAGDSVMTMIGAANRDPTRFEDPDVLNLSRSNNAHIAFGAGPHFCIGNQLARLEGQVSILRMAQQFPNMRLAAETPTHAPNFSFRGFKSLPVAL